MANTDDITPDAFARMLGQLEAAAEEFSTTSGVDDIQHMRLGIVDAITAFHEFLRANGAHARLINPTRFLLAAMGDIAEGRSHPLFHPGDPEGVPAGRPTIDNQTSAIRGQAAGIVTLLVKDGMRLQEAADRVARMTSTHGFQFSNRDDRKPGQALINFRRSLMAGRGRNPVAREVYHTVVLLSREYDNAAEVLMQDLGDKIKKVSKHPAF